MSGSRHFVAGGAGLIGTHLVEALQNRGVDVRASYHQQPPQLLPQLYEQRDLTQWEDCLEATRDCSVVYCCAAATFGVQMMKEQPTAFLRPNLMIQSGLLEACCRNRVGKVILLSSGTVYPDMNRPIKEEDLRYDEAPFPLYAGVSWFNRYVEKMGEFYRQTHGLRVEILRPASVYGPFETFDPRKSHVLPALIRRASRREDPFVVWGSKDVVRDFVYAGDVVEDLLALTDRDVGQPVHASSGLATTIGEAVSTILTLCQHNPLVTFDASKPTAVPFRVFDRARARLLLGTHKRTSLEEGLARTIRWYRENGEK